MLALFFEVQPKPDHDTHYFDRAAALRPILENQAGLLFLDRYRSLVRPNVILSHSLWRDEEAITEWRTESRHRAAQAAGRNVHFADYRIRIAEVQQTWPPQDREESIAPSGPFARTGSSSGAQVVVAVSREKVALDFGETFTSLNNAATWLTLSEGLTATQGQDLVSLARTDPSTTDVKFCSVIRDYGMFERDQAPATASAMTDASV